MVAPSMTHLYYFNPLTQTHSESYQEFSAHIHLPLHKKLPSEELKALIQNNGNFITLYTITTVFKHQLSESEMADCNEMDKRLCPHVRDDIPNHIVGTEIARGDIDLMRRILASMRTSIQALPMH